MREDEEGGEKTQVIAPEKQIGGHVDREAGVAR